MAALHETRIAGVMIPLFSLRTAGSMSSRIIGGIPDLLSLAKWMDAAGQRIIQLLPVNDVGELETSPYSSLSAFALDPVYISYDGILEREIIENVPVDSGILGVPVQYRAARKAKRYLLEVAYERFWKQDLSHTTPRAERFFAFRENNIEWLYPYALFKALKEENAGASWMDWPAEQRDGPGSVPAELKKHLSEKVMLHEFGQWLAQEQWDEVKSKLASMGLLLMGDLPFTVACDSADVWAHRRYFDLSVNAGAPPDQYSETGQDWGLPGFDWDRLEAEDYAWFRARAERAARLYDIFRIDHVVGLFRTWSIPKDGSAPHFVPGETRDQEEQGKNVLKAIIGSAGGVGVVAEDLGVIPRFVRDCMTALGVPGYKVLRWEKRGPEFKDPMSYPELSVATTGNHDTEPLCEWWNHMERNERKALLSLTKLRDRADLVESSFCREIHLSVIELLYSCPSRLVILPVQDLLGMADRINTPGTSGTHNWTWRLPRELEEYMDDRECRNLNELVKRACVATNRCGY